jgi:hypothetical protein
MKHGTENKLKFKELKRALRLPLWQVKGLLQSVWDFTADNAMHGDIGRFTDAQIALGIEYDGDAVRLISSLVDAGWLERSRAHRLIVHDWPDHCEEWVKKRVKRSGIPFVESDSKRRTTAKNETIELDLFAADDGGRRRTVADGGGLPNPKPDPKPENSPPPPNGGRTEEEPRKAEEPKEPEIPERIRTYRFGVAWGDWREHLKQKRRPLTAMTAAAQLAGLAEMGEERAIAAIRNSIFHGYTGLVEKGGGLQIADCRLQIGQNTEVKEAVKRDGKGGARAAMPAGAREGAVAWPKVLARLERMIDDESFETWIRPLVCEGLTASGVWLAAESDFYRDWVLSSFEEKIAEAVAAVHGSDGAEVQVRVGAAA